jgi:hypothetical protein
MPSKATAQDNSASFFKYQMRVIPSHKGLSQNTEKRADAGRRRGKA